MKYWYAMQGDNFKVAMEQKALWTCPRGRNRALQETRSIIFEMQAGDIVFHHAQGDRIPSGTVSRCTVG